MARVRKRTLSWGRTENYTECVLPAEQMDGELCGIGILAQRHSPMSMILHLPKDFLFLDSWCSGCNLLELLAPVAQTVVASCTIGMLAFCLSPACMTLLRWTATIRPCTLSTAGVVY